MATWSRIGDRPPRDASQRTSAISTLQRGMQDSSGEVYRVMDVAAATPLMRQLLRLPVGGRPSGAGRRGRWQDHHDLAQHPGDPVEPTHDLLRDATLVVSGDPAAQRDLPVSAAEEEAELPRSGVAEQ